MGELPPSCSTPQGPGVPRASRPGFLRVDSSGTSSAPSSRSVSFPFLASSSLHFTHLLSLGAFPPPSRSPFPSPSFPFLASSSLQFSPRSDTASSTDLSALVHSCFPPLLPRSFPFLASGSRRSLHFVPHTASRFVLLPLPRVSPRDSTLPRFVFSPLPVRLRFPQLPPPFPPASFPFLPLPFVQFSPVLSTLVLFGSPAVFPPIWRSDSSPVPLPCVRIPGSAAALSRLSFCGPRVAPKRPHTTPEKRQV